MRLFIFCIAFIIVVHGADEGNSIHDESSVVEDPKERTHPVVDFIAKRGSFLSAYDKTYYVHTDSSKIGSRIEFSGNIGRTTKLESKCMMPIAGGGMRKCTHEEELLRREIVEIVLEHDFGYKKVPQFDWNTTDLIWVRVTLPQSALHEFPLEKYKDLQSTQKINRFPLSTVAINKKDTFAKGYKRMQDRFGQEEFNFHPVTFVLPEDMETLLALALAEPQEKWIAKPVLGGQGKGIMMVNSTELLAGKVPNDGEYLVQRYIQNPFLVNDFKHSLRIYPLITSFNPLRVYLSKFGITKFATKKFTEEMEFFNTENLNMHITNQALNIAKTTYIRPNTSDISSGSRWSIEGYRKFLRNNLTLDDNAVWASIQDAVLKAMISAEPTIFPELSRLQSQRGMCFQLLGTDIDLDANLHPWLIESNVNPTINSKHEFERKEKFEMLKDMLLLVQVDNSTNYIAQQRKEIKENVMSRLQEINEKVDQQSLLAGPLTDEDIEVIVDTEYEEKVMGSFERLYPVPETIDKYYKFLEERHWNKLLREWIKAKSL